MWTIKLCLQGEKSSSVYNSEKLIFSMKTITLTVFFGLNFSLMIITYSGNHMHGFISNFIMRNYLFKNGPIKSANCRQKMRNITQSYDCLIFKPYTSRSKLVFVSFDTSISSKRQGQRN